MEVDKKICWYCRPRVQALSRQQVSQLVAMVENEEKVREAEIQFGARFQVSYSKIQTLNKCLHF